VENRRYRSASGPLAHASIAMTRITVATTPGVGPATPTRSTSRPSRVTRTADTSRRNVLLLLPAVAVAVAAAPLASPPAASARGLVTREAGRKRLPRDAYSPLSTTPPAPLADDDAHSPMLSVDVDVGPATAPVVAAGDRVECHYDVRFRGVTALSSRAARTLGANRTVAEPFLLTAGGNIKSPPPKKAREGKPGSGGSDSLYSGYRGPDPPQALAWAVLGMRRGGTRSVLVPAGSALGYPKGLMEVPPNQEIELFVEVRGPSRRPLEHAPTARTPVPALDPPPASAS